MLFHKKFLKKRDERRSGKHQKRDGFRRIFMTSHLTLYSLSSQQIITTSRGKIEKCGGYLKKLKGAHIIYLLLLININREN